ncbi:unnamed protein product [Microthlaspi erraticum]|uniref:F-box domain-containing protein n=1 Tax=Microthlaspi erraticum TaxID=1685480 RepID=A0A6D2HYQ8_9BRAS|nr:unnamed protein product [Microthlaspi erraticum]
MQSNTEPPNKPNHPPPPPSSQPALLSSLTSLPEDLIVSCLARISRSYYPKLALVSKSIRSIILSRMLHKVRIREIKFEEERVYLGLRSPTNLCLIWYSLWIKRDHQALDLCMMRQENTTGNLLVPVPSSYSLSPSDIMFPNIGSELYKCGGTQNSPSSSDVKVYNELTGQWREAPSMMLARKEPLTRISDKKIYVMGGCKADESSHWGEVFDIETQTWESLPDPGPEVRFSSNIKLLLRSEKIYVKATNKNFVYLIKEKEWKVVKERLMVINCWIENVNYYYDKNKCWWSEKGSNEGRIVKGLTGLDACSRNDTEIGTYGGELVMFWDSPALSPNDQTKKIWCAMILLDKRISGQVWGRIKWVDIVCTVPVSYTPASCVNMST